jgi:ABC-type antimicrobial peptide transport system permease subunit
LTAAGIGVGIVASLGLTRLIESQLFGVRPSDPLTLTLVFVLMSAVAVAAAWLPARRAARVDPVVALRAI